MIKIDVKFESAKFNNFIRHVKGAAAKGFTLIETESTALAEDTVNTMRGILNGSPYNLEKLANAINYEMTDKDTPIKERFIGIGRIDSFPRRKDGRHYYELFEYGYTLSNPWP